jgi:hypothetical protein
MPCFHLTTLWAKWEFMAKEVDFIALVEPGGAVNL